MRRVEAGLLTQVVAKEEEASRELSLRDKDLSRERQRRHDREVQERRGQDPEGAPNIEFGERDALGSLKLLQQPRTDQEAADPEKQIDAGLPNHDPAAPLDTSFGARRRVDRVVEEHEADRNRAPPVERRQVAIDTPRSGRGDTASGDWSTLTGRRCAEASHR